MQIAKYMSVLLASTLKFVGGPLAGLALGLSWPETAICTVLGMMVSVILVVFAGALLDQISARFRRGPVKRFSRKTRMAVRIWQRAGIAGIAFLTPILLTPIGGTVLAVSFRVNRVKLIGYMLVSAVVWAVVQTLVLYGIAAL
jgi:uncharacterized membrane protein